MASSTIKPLASGALFGAAITAAGVYSPAVIIGQMNFTDFHMLKAFITASASSAIAILVARRYGFSSCEPRRPSWVNLFSAYDGNIIGGALLGVGMTLTGACPGTVLPQIVTGIRSGPWVFLGCLVGGAAWVRYKQSDDFRERKLKGSVNAPPKSADTVAPLLHITEKRGLLIYEALCLGILSTATFFAPGKGNVLLPPVVGGLLIGASQLASLVLTGNALGISAAYETIWEALYAKGHRPSLGSPIFAAGTMLGSFVLSQIVTLPTPPEVQISPLTAVAGGAIIIVGSRLAGGCTSGHGISGMSMLSISSFISVGAMFAGGMGLAAIFRAVGW